MFCDDWQHHFFFLFSHKSVRQIFGACRNTQTCICMQHMHTNQSQQQFLRKRYLSTRKKRHARNFFSCSITYMDCTVSKSKCGILPHSSTNLCSRKRYKDRSGFPHRASSCVNSNRKIKATRNRNKNIQVKYSWINSAIIVDSCFIYSPYLFLLPTQKTTLHDHWPNSH